jgi:hypothetical protein
MSHVHRRDSRLSSPSVDVCACGAIRVGELDWLETSWEPTPLPPPQRSERPTTPLPLALVRSLESGGWCVRP